jgi:hypothetical protein
MKRLALLIGCVLLISAAARGEDDLASARSVLARYLAMPFPKTASSPVDTSKVARIAVLAELKYMPHGAVLAAEEVLFDRATPEQRCEIVGALGDYIHTAECAQLLYRVLKDIREPESKDKWEELVRSSAVLGLRRMASRTTRSGGQRVQTGPDHEPMVQGIVPLLIFAASDKSEDVRLSALYGLADSRDPAAVAELKRCLNDPSRIVRFYAACFLTEYEDASGLAEMCKSASQLQKPDSDFRHPFSVEQLLASFERITGKSFGEIPMNPILSSNSNAGASASKRYQELLHEWEVWCGQQPNLH